MIHLILVILDPILLLLKINPENISRNKLNTIAVDVAIQF